MMREPLELAREAGVDATLTLEESRNVEISFEFNRLRSIQNTESLSYTAQAIRGGKRGVARSTRPGDEQDVLDRAIRLIEYGAPVAYRFPDPSPSRRPAIYSDNLASLSVEKLLEAGNDLSRFIKALHPDVNGIVKVAKVIRRDSIANTKGLDASWEKTVVTLIAAISLVEGQNLVDLWDFHSSTDLDWNLDRIKADLSFKFDLARKNVRVETGSYDVLFTPRAFGDLISPVIACLDGKAVTRGISPFARRIGEQIFSGNLTIVEDGTMDGGVGSRMYDSQGVACRRTPLIEKGVLREYLLDLDTAQKLGRSPTGTGGIAAIEPNNLVVEGGEVSKDDLLRGIRRGIIIENTMGAWAGNPYAGQVSGNIAMGFLVVDGKPVGRIKDCMFSANAFTHLKEHLAALSRETKNMFGTRLPWALVRNVTVAAKND